MIAPREAGESSCADPACGLGCIRLRAQPGVAVITRRFLDRGQTPQDDPCDRAQEKQRGFLGIQAKALRGICHGAFTGLLRLPPMYPTTRVGGVEDQVLHAEHFPVRHHHRTRQELVQSQLEDLAFAPYHRSRGIYTIFYTGVDEAARERVPLPAFLKPERVHLESQLALVRPVDHDREGCASIQDQFAQKACQHKQVVIIRRTPLTHLEIVQSAKEQLFGIRITLPVALMRLHPALTVSELVGRRKEGTAHCREVLSVTPIEMRRHDLWRIAHHPPDASEAGPTEGGGGSMHGWTTDG